MEGGGRERRDDAEGADVSSSSLPAACVASSYEVALLARYDAGSQSNELRVYSRSTHAASACDRRRMRFARRRGSQSGPDPGRPLRLPSPAFALTDTPPAREARSDRRSQHVRPMTGAEYELMCVLTLLDWRPGWLPRGGTSTCRRAPSGRAVRPRLLGPLALPAAVVLARVRVPVVLVRMLHTIGG